MAIVSDAQLVEVLQKYNPWWRNPHDIKVQSRPHKRVVYYEALRAVTQPDIRRFAVLSGARRVGKTTVMKQIIEKLIDDGVSPGNILYVSFDNPIPGSVSVNDILSVYETLYPIEGDRWLFFDEIQYTEAWELWLKVIYDTRDDVRVVATGSASPVIEKGASDSGVGRWNVLRVPTLSFYEYCELLELPGRPEIPEGLQFMDLPKLSHRKLVDFVGGFEPLQQHFHRYLTVGGFPELALAGDDAYAQRMLREDVVDKVIKRDVLTLFNVRNPLLMERLFLYLCMTSSGVFNKQATAKELENISVGTIESYLGFLEKANLIYISAPMMVGSKAALKGRPKIYIADAAIRNAVLMIDDVLSDDKEMGITVETAVYKHIVSYYQYAPSVHVGYYRRAKEKQKEVDVVVSLPRSNILFEVKYRNNAQLTASDAIVSLSQEKGTKVAASFLITKSLTDYGVANHDTRVPVLRIPALPFMYLLGRLEAERSKG
jgi:predicted AAA+ superfamily ATPase